MAPSFTRRVQYVIPPPATSAPCLKLPPLGAPRNGKIGPILLRKPDSGPRIVEDKLQRPSHPRHRLGVAALALDTATQLVGHSTPEGILYTGGRDGMIMSWELGVPMKKRSHRYGVPEVDFPSYGRWEVMTGWEDDVIDEEEDDEGLRSDGDIIGDVKESGGRRAVRRKLDPSDISYEQRWEPDVHTLKHGQASKFRQCTQAHSDWVNDILLCNMNQNVISCSSDGTIKTWNPHSSPQSYATTIGSHTDYVRCLALGRERNWVASGSFDRTIKLWDLAQPRSDALMTLHPPESSGPKSSVYAIATDPLSHVIASGSPERVVRTWDPRSGKRIGKLVGHTDNIRAILMSDDGRYVSDTNISTSKVLYDVSKLLTGSADASIKLWSIASPQRCLHTFTHHTDSVWSLFSSHPSLEIFYSGDRSGLVCKVDVEGCSDIADGECIVICKDGSEQTPVVCEGINKIVAMDDNLVWTASGTSSIKRWRAPGRRATRDLPGTGEMLLDSPGYSNQTNTMRRNSLGIEIPRSPAAMSRSHTLEPAASIGRSRGHKTAPSITASILSQTSLHPRDADPESTLYGIPFESLVKLTSPNDPFSFIGIARGRDPEVATLYSAASVMSVPRQMARSPLQTAFPPPRSPPAPADLRRADTLSTADVLSPTSSARADYEERDVAADAKPLYLAPDDVIAGENGLVRALIMNDRIHALTVDTVGEVAVWDIVRAQCVGTFAREDVASASQAGSVSGESGGGEHERSPRQALETVRERIEGEAVVIQWAQADTRIGELTINIIDRCFEAEIFADEAGYGSDRTYNDEYRLSIAKWLLRNLFINFIREEQRSVSTHPSPIPTHLRTSADTSSSARASGFVDSQTPMTPAILPEALGFRPDPPLPQTAQSADPPRSGGDLTPMPHHHRAQTDDTHSHVPSSHPQAANADYFSLRRRTSVSGGQPPTPDDFSGWGGPGAKPPADGRVQTSGTPTPGGFMGRLKNFGKSSRRPASEVETTAATRPASTSDPVDNDGAAASPSKTLIQKLKSQPLNPPPLSEAPPIVIPPNVTIVLSEESDSGPVTLYRGTVGSAAADMHLLEEAMPDWLLEFLLANKSVPVPLVKIGFVLLPVQAKNDPNGGEQLPELLNTAQSKLSASRFLRVRKLVYHVQDKLDKPVVPVTTPRSSSDIHTNPLSVSPARKADTDRPHAEDVYEIFCNDYVLPLDMTLAAVRQYVWRNAGELVMYYRRKRPSGTGTWTSTETR